MKKRLPKATLSTLSEIHHESANESANPETGNAPNAAAAEASAREGAEPDAELPPKAPPPIPAPPARHSTDTQLRQAQALIIVERYTTYSALGGCIPLAIFDSISVGTIVFNMVRALAEHYHVPFQRDRVKAGVASLLAAFATPSLGNIATHLAGKLIPGAWLINTAVSSTTAAALTRYIGQSFIEHLESGGTTLDFDIARLKSYFRKSATA